MDTRKLILEATERMIRQRGLARVTTKEIAREAGCAEGTLYRHFLRKEDVFVVIIQQQMAHVYEHLKEDDGQSALDGMLERVAYVAIAYYQRTIPLASAFFADTDLLTRFREVVVVEKSNPHNICEYVEIVLKKEQERGRIALNIEPVNMAVLLMGACFQYVFFQQFLGENIALNEQAIFVSNLIQTLMQGISPHT